MLTKLLKYDLKSLFKFLTPIYLIAILLAFLTRIFNMAADKVSLLEYPAGFVSGLTVLIIIGIPFATFIISIIKYYNNMVKDEGYLTHTLPVKKGSLVISKLITSVLAMGASLIISIAIVFLAFNIGDNFFTGLSEFIKQVNEYDKWIILLISISVVVGYISNMLLIYSSISLGQMHSGNKAVYSLVFGVVIYNITQIVTSLILFAPTLFMKDYISNFDKEVPDAGFINGFLIYSLVLSAIVCYIYYFISKQAMTKKLNLD